MKKKTILLAISFLLVKISTAQTFQKLSAAQLNEARIFQLNTLGYTIGSTYGNNNSTTNAPILIAHTDNSFNITSEKLYSISGTTYFHTIAKTFDNGFIIVGRTGDWFTPNFSMAAIIKTDASGDTMWTRFFGVDSLHRIILTSVYQTPDSGYIVFGAYFQQAGGQYMIAVRLNPAGNIIVSRKFVDSGLGQSWSCFGNKTSDGNYIVTGTDHLIIKMDDMANILWTSPVQDGSGMGITENSFHDIYCVSDGYNSASNSIDIQISKTDSAGNLKWRKAYGTIYNDYPLLYNGINPTSDGGFILSGYYNGFNVQNYYRNYFMKFDSSGAIQYARNIGPDTTSLSHSNVCGLISALGGGYILSTKTLSSPWNGIRFVKTNTFGISGCQERNLSFTQFTHPANSNAPLYTWVSFPLQQFYVPVIAQNSSLISLSDICLTTLAENPQTENKTAEAVIFLNPATAELNINGLSNKTEVNLYNIIGEKILSRKFEGGEVKLDVKNLAPGIYVVKVLAGEKMFVKKVVKE
jgi:hypothetical protein